MEEIWKKLEDLKNKIEVENPLPLKGAGMGFSTLYLILIALLDINNRLQPRSK